MRQFIKLCHWLITLFHLVFIYFGLKAVSYLSIPEEILTDKKVQFLVKMARTNLWLYFSLWGVVLQVAYFLLVSILELCDTVPTLNKIITLRKQLENIRKHFFVSLVFPITLCVGVTFWVIYLYDREQIYPSLLDKVIAPWLNHAIHTIPPVLVFLHLFVADLSGISTRICLAVLICFDILYSLCFMWSGLVNGNWIYLICEAMAGDKLFLAISLCNLSTGFYFAVGRFLLQYVKSFREANNCIEKQKHI